MPFTDIDRASGLEERRRLQNIRRQRVKKMYYEDQLSKKEIAMRLSVNIRTVRLDLKAIQG